MWFPKKFDNLQLHFYLMGSLIYVVNELWITLSIKNVDFQNQYQRKCAIQSICVGQKGQPWSCCWVHWASANDGKTSAFGLTSRPQRGRPKTGQNHEVKCSGSISTLLSIVRLLMNLSSHYSLQPSLKSTWQRPKAISIYLAFNTMKQQIKVCLGHFPISRKIGLSTFLINFQNCYYLGSVAF